MMDVSAESGWLLSSLLICFSTSAAASGGMFFSVIVLRKPASSSDISSPSPSSCWIARTCCRRKYSRCERSISPRACEEISCCIVSTVISLARLSLTRRSRSIALVDSRIRCASSSFRSRLEAARSESLAGSSRFAAMTMTSCEIALPSETDFSMFCLTLRSRASCSGGSSLAVSGSSSRVILAFRYGSSERIESMRARDRPCTSSRIRPSGSFNMRMMAATVPTPNRSSGRGVSLVASRCATSMMIRCSASAASTAVIDFSRETESGRMMKGKTTTSFNGRTGRMSGIGSSGSFSAARASFSFSSTSGIGQL